MRPAKSCAASHDGGGGGGGGAAAAKSNEMQSTRLCTTAEGVPGTTYPEVVSAAATAVEHAESAAHAAYSVGQRAVRKAVRVPAPSKVRVSPAMDMQSDATQAYCSVPHPTLHLPAQVQSNAYSPALS